ncbi:MAG: hypothetical protein HYS70_00655 [Nitrospinae bacterium]|nr:hypothetical protein [Nitrospinota bacterium]
MDYEELFEKYQALLVENNSLKGENKRLKIQLGIFEQEAVVFDDIIENKLVYTINRNSESKEKIKLFMSLFKGRDDVYAKRWQNKEGKSGYMPVCLNEWKTGLCGKPNIKCSECTHKSIA